MSTNPDEIAIKVSNLSKTFKLPHEKHNSIKSLTINRFKNERSYELQKALEDINFEVKKGEFFGIVGRNGSGKSTLLKCIAGVYTPTKGSIKVNGSLVPFIELGVGFNPELSGRDNVFLNGALLGFNKKQVQAMYDEIVEFAELEKFMDQKLKNYSSGMQVRLAFSIAIKAQGDILLLDEVLAVGDTAFQEKCFRYFDKLKKDKKTVVLVSHNMNAIRQYCSNGVLINNGEVVLKGTPEEITIEYERLNFSDKTTSFKKEDKIQVRTLNKNNEESNNFEFGSEITFHIKWPKKFYATIAGLILYKNDELIFATNSINSKLKIESEVKLQIRNNFGNGRYKVRVGLFGENRHDKIGIFDGGTFTVFNQPAIGKNGEEWEGLIYIENKWVKNG